MNRTLSTIFAGDIFSSIFDGYTPSVRINETGSEYKLEMAVPGLTKSDLTIKSELGVLSIINEVENTFINKFKKQYSIPDDVNVEDISADIKNGILTVILPYTKNKKTTKMITIN